MVKCFLLEVFQDENEFHLVAHLGKLCSDKASLQLMKGGKQYTDKPPSMPLIDLHVQGFKNFLYEPDINWNKIFQHSSRANI